MEKAEMKKDERENWIEKRREEINEQNKNILQKTYVLITVGYIISIFVGYLLGFSPYIIGMKMLTYTVVIYIAVFVGWKIGRYQKLSLFLEPDDTEEDGL